MGKQFDKVSMYQRYENNGDLTPMISFWNQSGDVATDVNTVILTDDQYEYLLNKRS